MRCVHLFAALVFLLLFTAPVQSGTIMLCGTVVPRMVISVTGQVFGPEATDLVTLSALKPEQQSTITCKANVPYKVTATTIPQVGDAANIQVSYLPQSDKIISRNLFDGLKGTRLSDFNQAKTVLWGQPTLNRGEDCVVDYTLAEDNNLLYGDSVVAIVRYKIEAR